MKMQEAGEVNDLIRLLTCPFVISSVKQARPGQATQERSPRISRAKDPQPPTGRDHCPVFAGLFRLAPKVSAALGERSPRQGPVSPPANDDLDRGAQALPPACETEFRPSRPCPKRCAKFENGRLNFRAPSKFSSRPRCLLSFSTQARTAPFPTKQPQARLPSIAPADHPEIPLHAALGTPPSSFILHPSSFILSSLPDARPCSDRFRCGGRESKFLAFIRVIMTCHLIP